MTLPAPTEQTPGAAPVGVAPAPAPTERGWVKLLIALAAFFFLPLAPALRAFLPIDQTMLLFVPAMAACALVGWWAGGRAFHAIAWVAIATLMATQAGTAPSAFNNLVRGWSLLLAGAFGLVCLLSVQRPLFPRALLALGITLVLATIMSLVGPVSLSQASHTVADEFGQRNAAWVSSVNAAIQAYPAEWAQLSAKFPEMSNFQAETTKSFSAVSDWGISVFPALLALQSLAALALAWATYHRLARARLGAPLRPLREFRFNDQLVWGLIVGLTIMLVPTLTALRGGGRNLLVFFGALYAVRGFGVLTWFMAPGSLGITLLVAFFLLWAPVVNQIAALAFVMIGIASLALGLGDTWADWRSRARPTT